MTTVTGIVLSGKPASGFSAFAEGETVTLNSVAAFYSDTVFIEAYDASHLADLLDSNSSAPDWLGDDEAELIVGYAQQRADSRGEASALEAEATDCLITTNWSSFTEEWGFSGGSANQVAIGSLNDEAGSKADLFENTDILQTNWLRDGDGRKTQAERYEDDELLSDFDNSSVGDMWIPHAAQDYICIIELTGELLHGEPELSEAM